MYYPGYGYPEIGARSGALVSKCTVLMIRAAALWLQFIEVERPEVADQRPICSSKPAVQREEAGTAGIRQISFLPVTKVGC